MAKNDDLDAVLCDPRMTVKDFDDLYEVLGIKTLNLGIDTRVPDADRRVYFNT